MAFSRFKSSFREAFVKYREKFWDKKRARVRLHTSFRRSYREDYERDLEVPGLLSHALKSFKLIFQNWKLFGGLLLVITILTVALVGIMSEDTYLEAQRAVDTAVEEWKVGEVGNYAKSGILLLSTITSAGLSSDMTESQQIFLVLGIIIIWLTTIYLVRHLLNGEKPKLRDGLFNSLTPLLSTLLVFIVAFLQIIPILIVIITYSAAVATEFLATPFYALVYFIFAALMILLSLYWLSSTIVALIAVSAPGLYPIRALQTASDLMAGRRTRFIIRIIYLILVLAFIYIVIMMPVILLDLWLKSKIEFLGGAPIVPLFMLATTCFAAIYTTVYLYTFYRRILAYDYQK